MARSGGAGPDPQRAGEYGAAERAYRQAIVVAPEYAYLHFGLGSLLERLNRKKDAEDFQAQVRIDVKKGVHTPHSKSISVEAAGQIWIDGRPIPAGTPAPKADFAIVSPG